MMGLHSPVVLFAFNRPDTTRLVVEAIREVKPASLLVITDGPRLSHPKDKTLCDQVKSVVHDVDWDCDLQTNHAKTNLGCGLRLSTGLDWVFERVDSAIILEDDCVPSKSFFRFASDLLSQYQDDERVMMIGGTNYLIDRLDSPYDYFFSRYFAVWGWATWRRAWRLYDFDMKDWPRLRSDRTLETFYQRRFVRRHLARMFDLRFSRKVDTWDIQWFYSCLFNSGLSIVPARNLVTNVGVAGTHSSADSSNQGLPRFEVDTSDWKGPPLVHPLQEYDDVFFRERFHFARAKSVSRRLRSSTKLSGSPPFPS